MRYYGGMPSWNVHTAHVERLLAERPPAELGIADANAFLFGNYVPDIYLGYMVPEATYRIDYRITHVSSFSSVPVPNADKFWDDNVCCRRPKDPAGLSLALGAWAHLVTDRFYNGRFRSFWEAHDAPIGDALRVRKQADFDLFGRSLNITSTVEATPELLAAANAFVPYSILADDARRAISVASAIVRENASGAPEGSAYQLLDAEWMADVFEACNERLALWLATWQRLEAQRAQGAGARDHARVYAGAESIRRAAGLPPLTDVAFGGDAHWGLR